jgi:DNA-binding GntR family transcriptional regulator
MTSPASSPLPQRGATLTDQVMDFVRAAVISGELETGKLYSVYQIANLLGISRSPVRDGLLRLEEAGLVEFARNRGFRIIPTSPYDVAEIFSLRLALEVPAASRAANACTPELTEALKTLEAKMRAAAASDDTDEFFAYDQELHDLILGAAQSNRGRDIVNRLRVATRLLGVSTAGKQRTLDDIISEHSPLIEAVKAGQTTEAAAAMRDHLTRTGRLLVAQSIEAQGLDLDPEKLWTDLTQGY